MYLQMLYYSRIILYSHLSLYDWLTLLYKESMSLRSIHSGPFHFYIVSWYHNRESAMASNIGNPTTSQENPNPSLSYMLPQPVAVTQHHTAPPLPAHVDSIATTLLLTSAPTSFAPYFISSPNPHDVPSSSSHPRLPSPTCLRTQPITSDLQIPSAPAPPTSGPFPLAHFPYPYLFGSQFLPTPHSFPSPFPYQALSQPSCQSPSQSPTAISRPVPLLSSLNQANSIKLDGDNFLTWESTIMPIVKGHRLEGYLLGSKAIPPKYILDATKQVCPNPAYDDWLAIDQILLG